MSATWFPGITPSREMPADIDTQVVPAPAEASASAAIARKN